MTENVAAKSSQRSQHRIIRYVAASLLCKVERGLRLRLVHELCDLRDRSIARPPGARRARPAPGDCAKHRHDEKGQPQPNRLSAEQLAQTESAQGGLLKAEAERCEARRAICRPIDSVPQATLQEPASGFSNVVETSGAISWAGLVAPRARHA